jgi:NADH dehydrogenase FAD-containing subunit
MQKMQIAIIWWSFGGLSALLVLRKRLWKNVEIKLFEQRSHFCHIPALHEAVLWTQKRLAAMQIPYAKYYPEYTQASITKIESHQLTTANGEIFPFDYAVIATGSRTNFFDNPEREKNAFAVRYADDIPLINAKLRDPHTKTITIVGWGYTGVEIAWTIALRKRPDQTVRVIHSRERLFEAIGWLHKHNVEVIINERVEHITPDAITTQSGQTFDSHCTIVSRWIRINDESFAPHLTFDNDYTPKDYDHIFACGDVAGHGLIATAHNAMFEWRRMGQLIADRIQWKLNKHYPPLQNRDKLAIALGPYDGILTNGTKGQYIPHVVGFAKRIIERRVLFEYAWRVMLWI